MYGTIAHLRVRAGREAALREMMGRMGTRPMTGHVSSHVYQLDSDPREFMLAVVFRDKESYTRNADDPAQDAEYRRLRELLDRDPEWHDGEVVWSSAPA